MLGSQLLRVPAPPPSKYGVRTLQWGFFWSESVALTGLMLPLLLLGFICLFVNRSRCAKGHQEQWGERWAACPQGAPPLGPAFSLRGTGAWSETGRWAPWPS